jgi:UDP-glucuronate 4-epimerase
MIDRGQVIPVFGDGTSVRDYTFIDDTMDGIMAALSYDTRYDIFNLGNSPGYLEHVIATLEEALRKKAQIKDIPTSPAMSPLHTPISVKHSVC